MTASKPASSAKLWIGGEWVDTARHGTSIDPATGKAIGEYAIAYREEANQAITVAKQAFTASPWRHDRTLRANVLLAMADVFDELIEEFVDIISLENGKVKPEARFEASMAAPTLRFNAALALVDSGRASSPSPGRLNMVLRQPVGVAGVIAPWNSPLALAIRSVAPALAAGTTVVVSLPTQAAQFNYLFAQALSRVDSLPAGVVNVLTGGFEVGDTIVRSPDVPAISFTGSTQTGRAISANAAANLKRVGLELGGKHCSILFADADLDVAIPKIVSAVTVFAGQFCMTGSRLLVHSSRVAEVRDRIAEALTTIVVGPAADEQSQMGPLIDRPNVERVNGVVEEAIAAGASVIVRGGPVTDGTLASGAFYRPTLLQIDDPTLDIYQKEVFGPVLTLMTFDTEAQAIELANNSEYGLSATVFTRDADVALRVPMQLDAGTVWVNDWAALADQFEEGGFKSSGVGRMRGLAVIDDFVEIKHIATNPFGGEAPQ